jgi:hypothetical protein
MNDEPESDPGIEPGDQPVDADDARIRALLAELGSGPEGDAMPAAVAARLDDTLARLVAERENQGGTAQEEPDERADNVVPLQRRWGTRLGAAAAAVIVLGAGGVAAANLGVLGSGSQGADSTASSDSGAGESATSGSSGRSLTQQDDGAAAVPQVASGSFAADVKALLQDRRELAGPLPAPAAGSVTTGPGKAAARDRLGSATASPGPASACAGPRITDGATATPVQLDQSPAVLVVHPVLAGHRLVEAWNCAGTRRLASATLP